MSEAPKRVFCSFCGQSSKHARAMVFGLKGVAICNDCIVLAVDLFLIPQGLIHLSGPRGMIAADIGASIRPPAMRGPP